LPIPPDRADDRAVGGASARARLYPPGFAARIDLALTDEWPLAQAFVIISALPSEIERPG
jgi:holo-[acyl-carrier protein] synthase